MKKIFSFVLACLFSTCIVSCDLINTGTGNGGEDVGSDLPGELYEGTVILDAQKGSSARRLVKSETDWVASNTNTWFLLSSIQGKAGESELGVMSQNANEGLTERVSYFKINEEVVYVVQRGIISTSVESKEFLVSKGMQEVIIPMSGTFPIADMEISTDAAWAEFVSVDLTESPEMLADGLTESSFVKSAVKIAIKEENSAATLRSADVTIKAGDQTFTVALVQLGTDSEGVDYGKDFYRATVTIKGTGAWCGWCPTMSVQLHEVENAYPDRYYLMNVYNDDPTTSDDDILIWKEGDALMAHYNLKGYPAAFVNGYAEIPAMTSGVADLAEGLIGEAIEYYPANVAIAATSEVSGDDIKVNVRMAARTSREYKITIYILEDGFVVAQADYADVIDDPENYVHENVVRGTLTSGHINGGDDIELPLGEIVSKTFTGKIPSKVVDINKTNVLVFVTYEGGLNPDAPVVPDAVYGNFGYIIDNAVKIPAANGSIDFRYEK